MALVWLLVTEGLITLVHPYKNIPFPKPKLFIPFSFELSEYNILITDIQKIFPTNINFPNFRA
jgi:hypothetical protein